LFEETLSIFEKIYQDEVLTAAVVCWVITSCSLSRWFRGTHCLIIKVEAGVCSSKVLVLAHLQDYTLSEPVQIIYYYIEGVPGRICHTSGECFLG
jgi:hypothetical protein